MNKLPNYFLYNPLQKKSTITKYQNSDITDTPTPLCSVQQKVLEQFYFKYILLKCMLELSYLTHCERIKLDLITAIFRIPHDWLELFRYHSYSLHANPFSSPLFLFKIVVHFSTEAKDFVISGQTLGFSLFSAENSEVGTNKSCCPERISTPAYSTGLCPPI